MKILPVVLLSSLLVGCAAGGRVLEVKAPDGRTMKNTKCSKDPAACYTAASKSCEETSGSYRVVASHSNAGGLFADIFPGPVTWYNMTYICGPNDGKMPEFVLKGAAPAMPVIPAQTTTHTSCTGTGNSVNCISY